MKIPLVKNNITDTNIEHLCHWLKQKPQPQLSNGTLVKEFEEKYAKQQGKDYAVMVNSGSSANLLVVSLLRNEGKLKNNRVVIPALSWATTLAPWMQHGFHVIPCDNDSKTLGINLVQLEEIFKKEDPSVLMTVNVLGFSNDEDRIKELCYKYNVKWVIDDCEGCDGEYKGSKTPRYHGDLITKSFFISHFLTAVEGGVILTNDRHSYETLKMLRSHGMSRDVDPKYREFLEKENNIDEFNGLFTFYYAGYNLRSTEINAFIALNQLDRAEEYKTKRHENYELYHSSIKNDYWKIEPLGNYISPFAYPIITNKREKLVAKLKEKDIGCRPLIAGNIFNQPFWTKISNGGKVTMHANVDLSFADLVHKEGLYLPLNPDMTKEEIEYVCETVNGVINE